MLPRLFRSLPDRARLWQSIARHILSTISSSGETRTASERCASNTDTSAAHISDVAERAPWQTSTPFQVASGAPSLRGGAGSKRSGDGARNPAFSNRTSPSAPDCAALHPVTSQLVNRQSRTQRRNRITRQPECIQSFRNRKSDNEHSAQNDHPKRAGAFVFPVGEDVSGMAGAEAPADAKNRTCGENPEDERDVSSILPPRIGYQLLHGIITPC
jgi:hypothetical protein